MKIGLGKLELIFLFVAVKLGRTFVSQYPAQDFRLLQSSKFSYKGQRMRVPQDSRLGS